ncbi:maleylpyruvate isomerase family mycothiol-dependent enzyme [Paractinoplanes lichenicola]|uniref:Maleylpyruvate isomerase family mycothiol-dependent enzyme n=1 Tax=Paractinoplanes lichenicola TaxID=2802976 RepID=A0ABS1VNL7_9ACTN|nr:maleylpyruvate isomerase family mycothiol-dependent enzyme [Actinoplanes lichenicola]MBL7256327.1 maleylpyruvate isomerase family mycothiol-dependent enzyme [Actinoplanes lichenicola]
MDAVRRAIAGERRRVADLVESLSPDQLATPSLCAGWTVRQVAGHLVAAVDAPGRLTLSALLRSGFRIHRANARLAAEIARRPAADLAGSLRRHAENPFRPPVVGYPGQLADLQVHGQDMRRPLGLPHGLALDHLRLSLDFLTGGRAVGFTPRRRLAGLRFESTDLDWAYGEGALVSGPAEALMMALTGRAAGLGEIDGPGVRILAARLG